MRPDPLSSYRNRVARCPHGFAIGYAACGECDKEHEDGAGLRSCRMCHQSKPATELFFYPTHDGGRLRSTCKDCHNRQRNRRAGEVRT